MFAVKKRLLVAGLLLCMVFAFGAAAQEYSYDFSLPENGLFHFLIGFKEIFETAFCDFFIMAAARAPTYPRSNTAASLGGT